MFITSQQQGTCKFVRIMVFSSKTWFHTIIMRLFSNLFLGINSLDILQEGYTVHNMSMWCSSIQFPFNMAIGNNTLQFLIACYEIWSNHHGRILNLNGTWNLSKFGFITNIFVYILWSCQTMFIRSSNVQFPQVQPVHNRSVIMSGNKTPKTYQRYSFDSFPNPSHKSLSFITKIIPVSQILSSSNTNLIT